MPTQQAYLDYIYEAGQDTPGYLERSIQNWREQFNPHNALFGYAASGGPAAAAAIDAFLYERTGELRYAQQARHALLMPRELTDIFPAEIAARHPEYHQAVPPMDGLFVPPNYIPAYQRVRDSGVFSAKDHQAIAAIVADSLHTLFHFPEWGAHNRAMLRALSLAMAARAFPDHPEATGWRDLSAQLAEDSWGKWSIEDAMGYHTIWMLALFTYADICERPDFFTLPITYYYVTYFAHLFTPLDTFPDFGDCNWGGGAERLLPCFEKAAAVYREPTFKYIADRMFQHIVEAGPPSIGNALLCIQAYQWAEDDIQSTQPQWQSEELLDDLAGKKILFRSGWDPEATYLLLNYRDELGYGFIPRRYLRTTLAVSAEKMHHGHADENAIVLLLNKGAVLLHEGGYRDNVPNGRYRADIYHNRVIWRQGIKRADTSAWDFLHDDGSYKFTRTQKLHFARFQGMDFSRTQVTDEARGIEWDRIMVYVHSLECFVLIDAVKALREGPFTLANILYTTQILASGSHYYDTAIDTIGQWQNPQHRSLLISYPLMENRPVSAEQTRRHYQQETGLYQIWTGWLTHGDIVPFVTILWPHERQEDITPLVAAPSLLKVSHPDRSIAVQIEATGRTVTFGCKLDLNLGLLQQEIRPRYNYEAGHIRYGDFETDATHFYMEKVDGQLQIAFTEGTCLQFKDHLLYEGESHRMFQEDASSNNISPTWRERWEKTIKGGV
ncbi:MAG: hypothetical protein JXA33_01635 [Anaerolineae bacterium]|nr:hypothetical protein [Anaerolineae bacterium]